jgi:ABC-type uncharacterized transport system permease subunit
LGSLKIPTQLVQMIPYVATILALVFYALRQRSQITERMRRFQKKRSTPQPEQQEKTDA